MHGEKIFTGICLGFLVSLVVSALVAGWRPDVEGYEVGETQLRAYICEHVIRNGGDHTVAICNKERTK